jgi:hypothetical protein
MFPMFCLGFSNFFDSNHQVKKKFKINSLIQTTLNRWPVKILQGEEEEDLAVGDMIEENWITPSQPSTTLSKYPGSIQLATNNFRRSVAPGNSSRCFDFSAPCTTP